MQLQALEAEAIAVFREAAAQARRPVLLYSVGKDSSVLLHLARKAFHPGPVPFPLLHVDTGWKFAQMYAFRDRIAAEFGLELLVHTNEEGRAAGVGPFTHSDHTDVMKTVALRQALDAYGFDVAIGGARRDEERSRAAELEGAAPGAVIAFLLIFGILVPAAIARMTRDPARSSAGSTVGSDASRDDTEMQE